MAERFHVNCDLGPGPVDLSGPEAHHVAVVLRLRPGSQVVLFNGDGREYPAEIETVSKKIVQLRVLAVEAPQRERPARLEVAAALPKGDRAHWLLEKLTELGVTHFVPLRTAYSVVNPREERMDKLQRYIIEASKQCGRNVLMTFEPLVDWQSYALRADLPACRLIAHPGGAALQPVSPSDPVAVAVGPEGGFRGDEVEQACAAGWRIAGLGPRILRVETAAVALAAWFALGTT
jgi:16S rRNA (uracil1498-N3)-methyltransferase